MLRGISPELRHRVDGVRFCGVANCSPVGVRVLAKTLALMHKTLFVVFLITLSWLGNNIPTVLIASMTLLPLSRNRDKKCTGATGQTGPGQTDVSSGFDLTVQPGDGWSTYKSTTVNLQGLCMSSLHAHKQVVPTVKMSIPHPLKI